MCRFRRLLKWLPLLLLVLIVAIWGVGRLRTWQINEHGEAERQRVLDRVRDAGIPIGFDAWRQQAGYSTMGDIRNRWLDDTVTADSTRRAERAGRLLWVAASLDRLEWGDDVDWLLHEIGLPHRPPIDVVSVTAEAVDRRAKLFDLLDRADQSEQIDPGFVLVTESPDPASEGVGFLAKLRGLSRARQLQSLDHQFHGRDDEALAVTLSMLRLSNATRSMPRRPITTLIRGSLLAYAAGNVETTLGRAEPGDEVLLRVRQALQEHTQRFDPRDSVRWAVNEQAEMLAAPHVGFHRNAAGTAERLQAIDSAEPYEFIEATGEIGQWRRSDEREGPIVRFITWLGDLTGQDWSAQERERETESDARRLRRELAERTADLVRRPGRLKQLLAELTEDWLDAYLELKPLPLHEAYRRAQELGDQNEDVPGTRQIYPQDLMRISIANLTSVRLAIATLDLELHRRKHGTWPETIRDLPSDWPTDPFDGQPLRYRRTDNGCMIYSVAYDQTDDGGEENLVSGGGDQVFRLYDPELRNSPPPETPADSKEDARFPY